MITDRKNIPKITSHQQQFLPKIDQVVTHIYRNVPKFSDRQVWANSADPDLTAPRVLPDSLISSAEDAEDCVAKFTSLVRARD